MDDNEKAIFDHLLVMTEAMAGLKARLDDHDTRTASLAQRLEMRIAAIEQRLAALEPQGDPDDVRDALMRAALEGPAYPDDVRDALAELDAMTTKLDGFPPQDNVICWPPFDPDQPDQTLFMWRVFDGEDGQ